jgi:pterin-4a-carbinolamine dehydratase
MLIGGYAETDVWLGDVKVEPGSRDIGRLSKDDFIVATRIDKMNVES